jgi:hypothetical protein
MTTTRCHAPSMATCNLAHEFEPSKQKILQKFLLSTQFWHADNYNCWSQAYQILITGFEVCSSITREKMWWNYVQSIWT